MENVHARATLVVIFAKNVLQATLISQNANHVIVMKLDLMETLAMNKLVSVFVNQIMQGSSVTNAVTEITTIQVVLIVNVMFMVPSLKFVTKKLENVCARTDMDQLVVIVAFLVFIIIQNVFLAIVRWLAQFKLFVTLTENVHACKISQENVAINVWQDIINIQNVCLAIVTIMVQLVFHVIMRVNVIVKTILMERLATHAKKISITIHFAKVVIVIQLV